MLPQEGTELHSHGHWLTLKEYGSRRAAVQYVNAALTVENRHWLSGGAQQKVPVRSCVLRVRCTRTDKPNLPSIWIAREFLHYIEDRVRKLNQKLSSRHGGSTDA